jgi:2-dehydropantoate 2-reductase
MRIAVFGAGAIGSYFGAKFASGGADVHLVARGEHLEAIRRGGLTLVEPEGSSVHPLRATDDAAEIGRVDLVLFCVKSYDTEAAAARLAPLIGEDTAVLSLQNGIDNEERIARVIGEDHVLGGAAYILAAIEAPGVVRSNKGRIVVGALAPGARSAQVDAFVEAGRAGGVRIDAVPDVRIAKWEKYVLLVAWSAMSAATQLPLSEIRASPAASAMLGAIVTEAWSVGRALGVPLDDDLPERQTELVLSQPSPEATSLQHDLLIGHRMEVEALQGTLSRLGRDVGVPTPWTDAAYAILQPWAIHNERLSAPSASAAVPS